jgi:hypothetical protein
VRKLTLHTTEIDWILSLSCIIRSLQVGRRAEVAFEVADDHRFNITLRLPFMDMDKHSEAILNNFLNSIRQNTINVYTPCENYQKGKTIFDEQGSSFFEPRVCCPALPALGKTSSDSTSTSPAAGVHDIEDSIKLTEISVIKTDTDIERDIQPLVAAMATGSVPCR